METISCPTCNGRQINDLKPYIGHHPIFQNLRLVKCKSCGMVFANPMPDESVLAEYNAAYFDNAHKGLPKDRTALKFFEGIARLRLAHLESYLTPNDAGCEAMLEVGPGIGLFCTAYRARYPQARYCVVESDASCYLQLRQSDAEIFESFRALRATGFRANRLLMSHVLEHVSHPLSFLEEALSFLEPRGVVFIEVPCRDDEFKERHESHLLFFDKPSMQRLLERLGLSEIRLSYHGKEIERLKHERGLVGSVIRKAQMTLARIGIYKPSEVLSLINDSLMRSVLVSYDAHLEKQKSSWWLRALARKTG